MFFYVDRKFNLINTIFCLSLIKEKELEMKINYRFYVCIRNVHVLFGKFFLLQHVCGIRLLKHFHRVFGRMGVPAIKF